VAREEDFDIAASFNVVPAQPGEVLCDYTFDLPGLNVGNHPLERRTVEITACVTVINVKFIVQQAIFLGKVAKQGLLIADAHTLIFPPVLNGKAAVQGGNRWGQFILPVHW
jgi:hypothetical protein